MVVLNLHLVSLSLGFLNLLNLGHIRRYGRWKNVGSLDGSHNVAAGMH